MDLPQEPGGHETHELHGPRLRLFVQQDPLDSILVRQALVVLVFVLLQCLLEHLELSRIADIFVPLGFELLDLLVHVFELSVHVFQTGPRRLCTVVVRCNSEEEAFRDEVIGALSYIMVISVRLLLVGINLGLILYIHSRISAQIVNVNPIDLREARVYERLRQLIQDRIDIDHEAVARDCCHVDAHGSSFVVRIDHKSEPVENLLTDFGRCSNKSVDNVEQFLLM
jgi:hypothetical protein